jgi:hypothetical protein
MCLVVVTGAELEGSTVLLPELMSCRKPRSVLDTGLEENTVLGRTRDVSPPCVSPAKVSAADEGDNMGSSSPSAASILRRFSSRLGSLSGMMEPGLVTLRKSPLLKGLVDTAGGCIGDDAAAEERRRWVGRNPVVSTERRVDWVPVNWLVEVTTTARALFFPLLACCCAFSRAAISSLCSGIGASA